MEPYNAVFQSKILQRSAVHSAVLLAGFFLLGAFHRKVMRHVRERNNAMSTLHESEERLRSLLDSTPDLIYMKDVHGRYTHCNPAMERLLGLPRQAIIGKTYEELYCGISALHEQLVPVVSGMDRITLEGKIASDSGPQIIGAKKYFFQTTKAPVYDSAGKVIGICGVSRDVTEQEQLKDEKEELEEQYHQSQKMEAIGRLAGGVAHDLNNMLSPILGYSEILAGDQQPPEACHEAAEAIKSAAQRARDLVRQLLAFSRKQPLDVRPVCLNQIIVDFERLLRRGIRENIDIQMHLSEQIPMILADTGQIEQTIMNLAVNAQDAMPDGGTLRIETAVADKNEVFPDDKQGASGKFVMLTISDTGSGIDDETRQRLFEPFFTTKCKGEGTGLGLATVYGIVKQHGGNIVVSSEPSKGAVFRIYLPAVESDAPVPEPTRPSPAKNSGNETIMVVEDNELVRRLAVTILERRGYHVLSASCGRECLGIIDALDGPLHLVLTDIIMPDMNGKKLFEEVARRRPESRSLFMSGYDDDVVSHHGTLNQGIAFIQKPFSVGDLANKVRQVLDN